MNARAIFGLSILMTSLSSIVIATLFAWPWLETVNRGKALLCLVAPAYVSPLHWTQLPDAWSCFRSAAENVGSTCRVRRFRSGSSCHRSYAGTGFQDFVGRCGGMGIQRVGRGRFVFRLLPRRPRRPGAWLAWRRLLHRDCDRAPLAGESRTYLVAASAYHFVTPFAFCKGPGRFIRRPGPFAVAKLGAFFNREIVTAMRSPAMPTASPRRRTSALAYLKIPINRLSTMLQVN